VTPASACRPRNAFVTSVQASSGPVAARAGGAAPAGAVSIAGAEADIARARRARLKPPATPSGRNTMTAIRIAPMRARFRTALSPPVSDWVSAVTMTAPSAGPYQNRVPPRAAIMIASTASPTANVSATVTYVTNIAWMPPMSPAMKQLSAKAVSL